MPDYVSCLAGMQRSFAGSTLAYGSLRRGLLSGRKKADTTFTGEDSAPRRSQVSATQLSESLNGSGSPRRE